MTDIRIRGTQEECNAVADWMYQRIASVRSVSDWYPDTRKGQHSTLGRVYISIGELRKRKEEPGTAEKGKCIKCRKEGNIVIFMWNEDHYEGICPTCAGKYLDEQWVGNFIRHEHPETFNRIMRVLNPEFKGIYSGPSGMQEIWDNGSDPLEGME